MTESGKTFLARNLAKSFMQSDFNYMGHKVMVLRKPREEWQADECSFQTSDPEEFLREYRLQRRINWENGTSTVAFLELADADVEKFDKRFHKLFTTGRHDGFKLFYLTQRPAFVHPSIREQCRSLYLFAVDGKSVKDWVESFRDKSLMDAANLPQYEFLYKASRFENSRKIKLQI